MGTEWVTPGLSRMFMQWVRNGSRLGYRGCSCSGYGMGHAWVIVDAHAVGTEWVTLGLSRMFMQRVGMGHARVI